jgi:ketosteroid isomerase-like protein
MVESAEQVARRAYSAFADRDVASMLDLVDEDLEWTFLDPSDPDPKPAVCHGRDQLAYWMGRDSGSLLRAELEEVVADGEQILLVTRSPGIDALRARRTDDLNFHVLTVRDGKITALRAFRSRDEAIRFVTTA